MLYDMQTQSILFIWRGVGIANVSPNYVMLWQTLDKGRTLMAYFDLSKLNLA